MTDQDVLDYEKLVYYVVNHYRYRGDVEDLIQVGMIGLRNALVNYKDTFDTKFSTYATFWIRGEILKYLREDRLLKVNREMQKVAKSVDHAREVLTQKLMRVPTDTELSLLLDIPEEKIQEAMLSKEFVFSLDYAINGDEEKELVLADTLPYVEASFQDDIQDLRTELSRLPEEEQKLIQCRYFEDMTQSETSKVLGMTQVKVSRKETKILQKLRGSLAA